MLHIIDHICVAGQTICEDAIGWGNTYLFALDGASGLTGSHILESDSDAAWFSAGVRDGLCRALNGGDKRPTADILKEVLANLRGEYERQAAARGLPIPPDSPSACLALFREMGNEIEFFGFGDCVGVAETVNGDLRWFCDDQLPMLDDGVVAKMTAIHQKTGISVLEARQQCDDLLLKNRKLRNFPGGYWVLDLYGKGLNHAKVMRWKREELCSLSVFSDGFAQLAALFRLYDDYNALHQAMMHTSLQDLVNRLFCAQEMDAEANRFPRLKFRDDVCALCARVSHEA